MIDFIEPVDPYLKCQGTSGIYGLIDPISRSVRYVGSSKNIQRRYYGHLHNTSPRYRTPKECWIRDLKLIGNTPLCALLEEVSINGDRSARHAVESAWIEKLHQTGEADLNLQMHPTNTYSREKQVLAENRRLLIRLHALEAKVRKYEGLGYDLI